MRYQAYGFSISFVIHLTAVVLLLAFCRLVPTGTKTLQLDLTTFTVQKPKSAPVRKIRRTHPVTPPRFSPAVKEKPAKAVIQPVKRKIKVVRPQPEKEEKIVASAPPPPAEPTIETAAVVTGKPSQTNISAEVSDDAPPDDEGARSVSFRKQEYIKAHFLYIKEEIQKKITYPVMARKMGWEGKVVVSFVICEDGSVIDIKIVKSSGFKLLDKNAVDSIKKAMPFPNPPVRAELIVPVVYRLS